MGESRGLVRVETGAKRVRTYLGGVAVADTVTPLLVWEGPYYPTYYFPVGDVRTELLTSDGGVKHSPSRGDGELFTVRAGGREAAGAAERFTESPIPEISGHVRFDWAAMDSWFEEDEEVFVHARNPQTRIDVLASSRHVRVEIDGVTVADSTSPHVLFETNLPARFYLPKPHVRLDLLEKTDTRTGCPYKGFAEYWSVRTGDNLHRDVVWSYPSPLPESRQVAGLMCFYNEKVDIYLDGALQQRPATKFA